MFRALLALAPGLPSLLGASAPESFDDLFLPDPSFPYFEQAATWPVDDAAEDWSPARAAFLAQLSTLVYLPDAARVRAHAVKAGLTEATFIEAADTQVWVFASEVVRVVVFRGTEPGNTDDLLTDLRFLPGDDRDGVRAHAGFANALETVAPQLDALLETARPKSLWLTGHSLGGALAQLYAWRWRERHVAGVVVFGAPRVFLAADRERINAAFRCSRVVNNNDVVPHLPTPPLYAHVGEEWFIDATGNVHREPSLSAKLGAAWEGHRAYAERWWAHWQNTRDRRLYPGDTIADHAPAAYARALIAAARSDVTAF